MKFRKAFAPFIASILIVVAVVFGGAACSLDQVERAAQDVQFIAGGEAPAGEATTRPSAAATAVRSVVDVVKAVGGPGVAGIVSAVGVIAGVVGGIAGNARGKKTERRQAHTVIRELAEDFKAFKDPTTPWTDDTRRVLETLGYHEVAAAVPAVEAGWNYYKSWRPFDTSAVRVEDGYEVVDGTFTDDGTFKPAATSITVTDGKQSNA